MLQSRVQSQVYPSTVNLQPKESPKQRNNNSSYEFGHISSDSLLNPNSAKSLLGSTYLDFSSSQDKQHGNHSHSTWPEELKSDWTQLSMSIPVASSSPSSTHITGEDKTTLSPLRLSRESDLSEQETLKKVNTWIPISWGNSLGGPLGEVLNSTTNSPTLGSSPTGVLQKSTFCPLSNSNGSPIAESNNRNTGGDYFRYTTWGGSFCSYLFILNSCFLVHCFVLLCFFLCIMLTWYNHNHDSFGQILFRVFLLCNCGFHWRLGLWCSSNIYGLEDLIFYWAYRTKTCFGPDITNG